MKRTETTQPIIITPEMNLSDLKRDFKVINLSDKYIIAIPITNAPLPKFAEKIENMVASVMNTESIAPNPKINSATPAVIRVSWLLIVNPLFDFLDFVGMLILYADFVVLARFVF